jgi:hypothetical protein
MVRKRVLALIEIDPKYAELRKIIDQANPGATARMLAQVFPEKPKETEIEAIGSSIGLPMQFDTHFTKLDREDFKIFITGIDGYINSAIFPELGAYFAALRKSARNFQQGSAELGRVNEETRTLKALRDEIVNLAYNQIFDEHAEKGLQVPWARFVATNEKKVVPGQIEEYLKRINTETIDGVLSLVLSQANGRVNFTPETLAFANEILKQAKLDSQLDLLQWEGVRKPNISTKPETLLILKPKVGVDVNIDADLFGQLRVAFFMLHAKAVVAAQDGPDADTAMSGSNAVDTLRIIDQILEEIKNSSKSGETIVLLRNVRGARLAVVNELMSDPRTEGKLLFSTPGSDVVTTFTAWVDDLKAQLLNIKSDYDADSQRRQADKTGDMATIARPDNGGIDLNTSNGMQWKVSKDGNGVEMDINPAMIARVRREGINWLSPVIFKMTPVASVWPIVGLQEPIEEERLARA